MKKFNTRLKEQIWILKLYLPFLLLPGPVYASTQCEVGNETKGQWVRIGPHYQGECKIPGTPDSMNNYGTEGYRVEGKYKVVARLSGKGFFISQPTCEPECLSGMAEEHCTTVYGFEAAGQNCIMPDGNKDGKPDGYACFSGNYVTLYEWKWYLDECDSQEQANSDPGKPCPMIPVDNKK